MEKNSPHGMNQTIRIVITGPECTGKSTLTARLAEYSDTSFVPEYAREYIEGLDRKYTHTDILHIAEKQLNQVQHVSDEKGIVFYDTWLIITKVWFEVLYGHYPLWIDQVIKSGVIDLWLICATDIPWIADNVRENGGEMREQLFHRYLSEIKKINGRYEVINGTGDQRFLNALKVIKKYFPDICA
jgi:NadR type nicotinamide-nucleotide adenylyltransferase